MKTKSIIRSDALRSISLLLRAAIGLTAVCAVASEPESRTMTGRLVTPPDRHWNLSETRVMLQEQSPPFPIPPEAKAKGRSAEQAWFQAWKTTEEARALFDGPRRKYDVSVSNDGSFSIKKVVPGDYWLHYTLPDELENEPVSMGHKTFSLSPEVKPWALGEIRMVVLPRLVRGERAPQYEVKALDGTAASLQSCEGKVVFLHFWSTECAACMAEMPAITRLYAEFGDNPGFMVLGFNLDGDRQKARDYIAKKRLVWPQVLLGSWKHEMMRDFHVLGIPSSFLLDPHGRVFAKNVRRDELSRETRRCLADAKASGGTTKSSSDSRLFQMRLAVSSAAEKAPPVDWERMVLLSVDRATGHSNWEVLYVEPKVLLDQGGIEESYVAASEPSGEPEIVIRFTDKGRKRFGELTRDNIGKRLAIIIDGQIYSALVIRTEIPGGMAHVAGNFSMQEARDLSRRINEVLKK